MERHQAMMKALEAVGFLGLSGVEPDAAVLARATAYFKKRAIEVRMLPGADAAAGRFAGSVDARIAALDAFLEDASIGLILGLRGGYGLTQLLPYLEFDRIARAIDDRGLMFCGFSDFTAFSLALYGRTGHGVFAGPSAVSFGQEALDPFTESSFWQALDDRQGAISFQTDAPPCSAEGPLWGGNLSMLVSLLGTPYFPDVSGGILFVEEVNEHPYRVERMLLQLAYAGVLERQSALVIGQVTNYRLSAHDAGFDMPDVIAQLRHRVAIPVVPGLPFGHVARQATLLIGAPARIESTAGQAVLQFGHGARLRPAVAA